VPVPIVVADTGPINYLILIGHIDVLPVLFGKVILPSVVRDELTEPQAPLPVQNWIAAPPGWLEVRQATSLNDVSLASLDDGEKAAITLAIEFHRRHAQNGERSRHSESFTASYFHTAAVVHEKQINLLNLTDALDRLKQTSFHYSQEIIDQFLAEQGGKG